LPPKHLQTGFFELGNKLSWPIVEKEFAQNCLAFTKENKENTVLTIREYFPVLNYVLSIHDLRLLQLNPESITSVTNPLDIVVTHPSVHRSEKFVIRNLYLQPPLPAALAPSLSSSDLLTRFLLA
jgi:hypothetical protein